MPNHEYENIQVLIAMDLAGKTSDLEKKYLQEQIAGNREIEKLWHEMYQHHHSDGVKVALENVDRDQIWKDIDAQTTFTNKRPRTTVRILRLAGAASILLAIGVYTYTYFQTHTSPAPEIMDPTTARLTLANGEVIDLSQPKEHFTIPNGPVVNNSNRSLTYKNSTGNVPGINTLWSPAGADYKITLADGTMVHLNAMTKLSFPFQFTGKTREITIDGEAYLKVANNPAIPFVVHTPDGDIEVLGTEFNVNTYDHQQSSVALVKGAVKLLKDEQTTLLKPGYKAFFKGKMKMEAFDPSEELSWREGLHLFNNASLEEIVKVLPRWYGIEVVLDNPATAKHRFTGYIDRNRPISDFLKEIKATADADYYFQGQVLHFR